MEKLEILQNIINATDQVRSGHEYIAHCGRIISRKLV